MFLDETEIIEGTTISFIKYKDQFPFPTALC